MRKVCIRGRIKICQSAELLLILHVETFFKRVGTDRTRNIQPNIREALEDTFKCFEKNVKSLMWRNRTRVEYAFFSGSCRPIVPLESEFLRINAIVRRFAPISDHGEITFGLFGNVVADCSYQVDMA